MISIEYLSVGLGLAVAAVALVWAAASDLSRYLIPNRVCALVAGAYGIAFLGLPPMTWLAGLATGVAVLALGAVLFFRNWVGGGDVKLAAVIALWAGPAFLSDFALVTSLVGAALSAIMLSPLRRLMPQAPGADGAAEGLRQPMPFGVPLAAGGLWVLANHLATNL
jgi:prepilin peptidase CpaA